MPVTINDYFSKASNGTAPIPATLSSQKIVGASSLALSLATGWDTSTPVNFVLYKVDANNALVVGTVTVWKGILSGTTVSSLTLKSGNDDVYPVGSVVQLQFTSAEADDLITGLLVSHNQDGTLVNNVITSASQVTDGILGDAEMATAVKPVTLMNENTFDHIASGCVWTGDSLGSTLNASCTSGIVYINGKRLTVTAVTARAFTASKDVYDDLHDNGDGTAVHVYSDNTTNAVSPALAASSVRNGIVVTGANIAAAASINQGQTDRVLPIASSIPYTVTDSLGNLIAPRDPNRRLLGYRQITANFQTSANGADTQIAGLSCPVIIPSGRRAVVLTYMAAVQMASGAPNIGSLHLWQGTVGSGTQINASPFYLAANNIDTPTVGPSGYSPPGSSGAQTYNASIIQSSAIQKQLSANSIAPAWIAVRLE